jgi:hypothetical protein
MQFSQIATHVEQLRPECTVEEVARLCVLALGMAEKEEELHDEESLFALLKDGSLKLKMSTDHHAAVKEELVEMTKTDPKDFQKEHIWTLVRAINVQDQLLQMYAGLEPLDRE